MASLRRIAAITLGAATLGSAQHPKLGGYYPVSNVIEHAQMVFDVEAISLQLGLGKYAEAKTIYSEGRTSCKSSSSKRSLQGFVSEATYTGSLKSTAFACSFTSSPCGPSEDSMKVGLGSGRLALAGNFWDKFITDALDGTGDFAGKSDAMRKTAVKKGVLGVLTMYSAYELESAITKAFNNETEDNQAAHAWDEGWAFMYGSHPGSEGFFGAWEFTMKRDSDFCVDADNKATVAMEGKSTMLKYFMAGQKASREGDVATMVAARNDIYRVFALSSIRAALKYSALIQYSSSGEAKYNDEYHMEAYAYFLAAAGWIEQASPNAGKDVLALLDFKKSESQLTPNVYCEVKAKLVAAYAGLGLDCDLVGNWKGHNSTVLPCTSTTATCPAKTTVPAGISYTPTDSSASVGTNTDCGVPFDAADMQETSRAPSTAVGAALILAALSSLLAA